MAPSRFLPVLLICGWLVGCASTPPPAPPLLSAADLQEGRLSLDLPLVIPLSQIAESMESGIPRSVSEERSEDFSPLLSGDFYRYQLGRGPVEVGFAAGRLTFRLQVAGRVTAGGRLALLGLPLTQEIELRGTVVGSAGVSISERWQVAIDPEARLQLERADVELPGGKRIDVRGVLEPRIDEALQEQMADAGPRLASDLDLRGRAAGIWREMHLVRRMGEPGEAGEGLWLQFQPASVRLAPLEGDDTALRTGLAVEGRISLVVAPAGQRVSAPAASPLPALATSEVSFQGTSGQLEAELPVAAPPSVLSPWLERELRGARFRAGKGRVMQVDEAVLSAAGEELVLALDFRALETGRVARAAADGASRTDGARGRLTLRGRPVLDVEAGVLRLRDLRADLSSDSFLLRYAGWRHRSRLLAEVEKRAVLELGPVLQEVEAQARAAVQQIELPAGVGGDLRSGLRLDPVEILGVGVADGVVVVRCRITGTAAPLTLEPVGRSAPAASPQR
jgi:hypothetical protein